jgi:hypothetical protein
MKLAIALSASMLAIVALPALAQNAAPTIPGPGTGGAAATTENASNIIGGAKTPNEPRRSISEDNAAPSTAPTNGQARSQRPDEGGKRNK